MINFVQYPGCEVNPRKGHVFDIRLIPVIIQQELDARRKVGIWWLQSSDEDSEFRVIGRSVIDSYKLNGGYAYMDVDLSESYKCLSSIGNSVKVKLADISINGTNFTVIDDNIHSLISASVRNSSSLTLSKTIGYSPGVPNHNPDESLIDKTRELFSDTFSRNVNEPYFKRRKDTHFFISGVGINVLESLIKKLGIDPVEACYAVIASDPICRDIIIPSLPVTPDTLETFPKEFKVTDIIPSDTFEPYFRLTRDALKARTYSEPVSFRDGMEATQRAENVHQQILKSIFDQLGGDVCPEVMYSKLADIAIFDSSLKSPLHLIEIKSITPENIDNQYSQGLIQLSRLRFLHRVGDIKFHLVAERTSVAPPAYLLDIARQLDVVVHEFDYNSSGLNTCQSLYNYLYNSYEKPRN